MNRSLVAVPAIAVFSLFPAGLASATTGGYGPTAPTGPAGTPGGFNSVVTTQSFDGRGGTLDSNVAGAQLSIAVPTGAFTSPVQVEVTKPDLTAITPATLSSTGFSGYSAVAGLGVKVLDTSGAALTGTFAKPLDVTISGTGLGKVGEKVLELTGASSATVVDSSLGNGSITVHLSQDPNLVVVNPTAGSTTTVPGATQQVTGKPFTGETLAAVGLIGTGLAIFAAAVFRRRRAIAA